MTQEQLMIEARGFAKTYLSWYNERHQTMPSADIFLDGPGEYRLISSGCGINGVHDIICRNLSADLFGDPGDEPETIDDFADMLVESGYMAEMLEGDDDNEEA